MKTITVPIPTNGGPKRVQVDLAPGEQLGAGSYRPQGEAKADKRPVINEFRAPRGFLPQDSA